MNDLLFMISMSLSFVLPLIALAIALFIERQLDKRKNHFLVSFFLLCYV